MRRSKLFETAPRKPNPAPLGLTGIDLSKQQERRIAAKSGGRRMPASGSKSYAKGDVAAGLHLIECKTTGKVSLRIEQRWLTKISREAAMRHKTPALVFSFPDMASDVEQDWIIIPMNEFLSLESGCLDAR